VLPVGTGAAVAPVGEVPFEGSRVAPSETVGLVDALGLGEAAGDDSTPPPDDRPVAAPPEDSEAVGPPESPTAGVVLSSLPCAPPEGPEEDPPKENPAIRATTTPPATTPPLRARDGIDMRLRRVGATSPHRPSDDRRPLPRRPPERFGFRREGLSTKGGGTYASSATGGISRVSSYAFSHPCATAGSAYSSYEGAHSGCGWYTFGGP